MYREAQFSRKKSIHLSPKQTFYHSIDIDVVVFLRSLRWKKRKKEERKEGEERKDEKH